MRQRRPRSRRALPLSCSRSRPSGPQRSRSRSHPRKRRCWSHRQRPTTAGEHRCVLPVVVPVRSSTNVSPAPSLRVTVADGRRCRRHAGDRDRARTERRPGRDRAVVKRLAQRCLRYSHLRLPPFRRRTPQNRGGENREAQDLPHIVLQVGFCAGNGPTRTYPNSLPAAPRAFPSPSARFGSTSTQTHPPGRSRLPGSKLARGDQGPHRTPLHSSPQPAPEAGDACGRLSRNSPFLRGFCVRLGKSEPPGANVFKCPCPCLRRHRSARDSRLDGGGGRPRRRRTPASAPVPPSGAPAGHHNECPGRLCPHHQARRAIGVRSLEYTSARA